MIEITREDGEVVTLNENEVMHVVAAWANKAVGYAFTESNGRTLTEVLNVDGKVNIEVIKE